MALAVLSVAGRLLAGGGVSGADAAPFAYIPNVNDATVSVIDTATDTAAATVTVGSAPFAFGLFIGPSLGAVPTLSEWALLGLALALVALGGWRLAGRRRRAGSVASP